MSVYNPRSKLPCVNGFWSDMSSIGFVAIRSPVATPCPIGTPLLWSAASCADREIRLLGMNGSSAGETAVVGEVGVEAL